MDKDYYQLPYTHEELLELLERIKNLESIEGIQGPAGPQGPPGKDADVSALQQEIAELKSTINELTQVPEIVIANKNIESEMEYLNERTQDENVIGIIINFRIGKSLYYLYPYLVIESFINNKIMQPNSILEKNIIRNIQGIDLKFKETKLYNEQSKTIYFTNETRTDSSDSDVCWDSVSPLDHAIWLIKGDSNHTYSGKVFSFGGINNTDIFYEQFKNNEVDVYADFVFYFEVLSKNSSIVKSIEIPYSTKIIYNW